MADTDMTPAEREAFLADLHVGVLAVEHPGHGPLALPIWYQFEDGVVVVHTEGSLLKTRLMQAAGRATLTVQDEKPPYKYVSVEGPVEIVHEHYDALPMATRYLGADLGSWYVDANPPGDDSVTVRLRPERWRTVDYAKTMG
jgi:hypothetical protein